MMTSFSEDEALSSSSSLSVLDRSRSTTFCCDFGDMNKLPVLFCDDGGGAVGFGFVLIKSGIGAAAPSLKSHFGGFRFRSVRLGKREVVLGPGSGCVVWVIDVAEGVFVAGVGFGFVACVGFRLGFVFDRAEAREALFGVCNRDRVEGGWAERREISRWRWASRSRSTL